MTFNELHKDTSCDCIVDAKEDLEDLYVRRIKQPTLKPTDFMSYWEVGKRPKPSPTHDCGEICGLKGISVNIWNDESQQHTIEKYLKIFRISPNHKDGMYIFKFRKGAGLVKHTPKNDPHHYDFYKCDSFTQDLLEPVEIISLKDQIKT